MFSKKLQPAVQSGPSGAGAASRLPVRVQELARLVVSNPYAGAAAAGGLLLLAVTALILVGDPRAGAPSVRIALNPDPVRETAGWRTGHGAEQVAGATEDPLLASIDPGQTSEGSLGGEAIITLPNGERQRVATTGGGSPLAPAPFAGMTQPGPGGLLPIIAADGRTPATAYARPFVANGKPKVAIVIGGLGIKADTTRQAIETLPPEVTLSFAVYAEGLQGWIDLARQHGHEVLIEAPMEPTDYPQNDPGPYTLLANARPEETAKKLDWILSRATGYFGVTNYMGSRFIASNGAMSAFASNLAKRGVAFVDDGTAAGRGGGVPRASANTIIDENLSGEAISRKLAALEATAGQKGQALGSGFGYSVTVQQVAAWSRGLASRGYQLAPASALALRR